MESGKFAPAPIFNHRKRPRQDFIADPQDTKQSSNRNIDLMPVGGFGAAGNQQKYTGHGFQRFSSSMQQNSGSYPIHLNQARNNRQENTQNYYDNSRTVATSINQTGAASSLFKGGNPNYGQQKTLKQECGDLEQGNSLGYRQNAVLTSQMSRPNISRPNYVSNINQQSTVQQNQIYNSKRNYPSQSYQNNKNNSHFQNSNQQNYLGAQSFSHNRNNPQYSKRYQQGNLQKRTSIAEQDRFQTIGGGLPIDRSPARGSVFPSTSNTFSNKMQSLEIPKERVKPKSVKRKIDSSLHVMTSSLSRIAYWTKYRDSIHMIFEVFGIIDSAVVWDSTCTHKEFILRDEQQHMKCIFYEIDRSLPKLTRGQWHRCIGTYDYKKCCFKCVSVRPATVEEKNHGRKLADQTNDFLKKMTEHLPGQ